MQAQYRIHRTAPPGVAFAIIACALMIRALVPQGWMPTRTVNGWGITICSGMEAMPMGMRGMADGQASHHPTDGQPPGPHDHPCAFSSLFMALDEPRSLPFDGSRLVVEAWLAHAIVAVGVATGLAAPPPPSTGPPPLS